MSTYLGLDYLIVYAFLLITLVIGLWTGGGISDIRAYATANKMFGTGALVLTWLATDVAGETVLDMASSVRTVGVIQPLVVFGGWGIALLMQALLFAPRFTRFPDCITMGDVMGQLYGIPSQVMTGILGFFTALCIAGMELTVLGILCETLLGIDFRFGVGIGGFLLVLYTTYGGIKSVAFTDLFQGLILLIVLPIITVVALKQAGGIKNVFTQVPVVQFQLLTHPKISYYAALFLSLSVFQFSVIDPALMQRILLGRTGQQLRHQFFIVAACLFALMVALSLLGLSSIVLYPNLTEDVLVVPHMVGQILPIGLKGFAMAGLFAITMATFDSFLHAAGLTLIHDIVNPVCKSLGNPINELSWVRYVTIAVGLIVMGVGFTRADELYSWVLLSYKFTGPLLAFPLFAGVCGLKPDLKSFYTASGVTIVVLLLAEKFLSEAQNHWVPIVSVITNGICFLGMHAVLNRGFVVHNIKQREKAYLWRAYRPSLLTRLKQWLPTPQRIVQYSQKQVARYGASYMLFSLFCCINYLVPYFMWEHALPAAYSLMLYLRTIGAIACGLILIKDKWPASYLSYLPIFWHFTLLYCLPFTSTVMFLLTGGSAEWLINVAITIMFLIVLVDWVSFVILTVLGISLGLLFYQFVVGPISLRIDFSTGYLLVYQAIFATLIGLLFARRKQQRFDKLNIKHRALVVTNKANQESLLSAFREKIRIIQTLKHVGVQDLLQVAKLIKEMRVEARAQALPLLETATKLEATLIPMALQLRSIEARATNFLGLSVANTPISHILATLESHLTAKNSYKEIVYHQHTQVQAMECDPQRFQTLLVSSVTALQSSKGGIPVCVGIEDTQLYYALPSVRPGYHKQVAALRFTVTTQRQLPNLQPHYVASMNGIELANPETAQELVLMENRRIVSAHYGYMHATPDTFFYVLPVALQEVRSKDMDAPHMELGTMPIRADDHYPGAQAQEQAFLEAVQKKSTADIELVKSVLELIKWYHGPFKRQTGEPFYLHPLAVAQIVLDYNQEEATVLAALLHDTVEDTALLLEDIEAVFGQDIANIVDTVTHLESRQDSFYKIKLSAEENVMMLLEAGNDRAMYVKLADRIHNLRTIQGKDLTSQVRIAKETLQFFVPQAQRLGLQEAVKELIEKSWKILEQCA